MEEVTGSSPVGSTSKSLSEKRDFYFCAECACLLYKLAVLLVVVRFELGETIWLVEVDWKIKVA